MQQQAAPAAQPSDAASQSNSSIPARVRIQMVKKFEGFKFVKNIKDRYKIGKIIGEGAFG